MDFFKMLWIIFTDACFFSVTAGWLYYIISRVIRLLPARRCCRVCWLSNTAAWNHFAQSVSVSGFVKVKYAIDTQDHAAPKYTAVISHSGKKCSRNRKHEQTRWWNMPNCKNNWTLLFSYFDWLLEWTNVKTLFNLFHTLKLCQSSRKTQLFWNSN